MWFSFLASGREPVAWHDVEFPDHRVERIHAPLHAGAADEDQAIPGDGRSRRPYFADQETSHLGHLKPELVDRSGYHGDQNKDPDDKTKHPDDRVPAECSVENTGGA